MPPIRRDDVIDQIVENDNDRAGLVVAQRARAADGTARTVLEAAASLGEEGASGQPGIETLVVMLGANNALGAVVHLDVCWSSADYLDLTVDERLAAAASFTVFRPSHFAAEWAELVEAIRAVRARHVILATVPAVTIPPVTRGVGTRSRPGSRYFRTARPWITDEDFDPRRDLHLTEDRARTIDSAIDAPTSNGRSSTSVRTARTDGLDWHLFDLGGCSTAHSRGATSPTRTPGRPGGSPTCCRPSCSRSTPSRPRGSSTPDRRGPDDGGLFALDGVHPTTIGYGRIIAQEVVRIMDAPG
jgi:hypothetical protein